MLNQEEKNEIKIFTNKLNKKRFEEIFEKVDEIFKEISENTGLEFKIEKYFRYIMINLKLKSETIKIININIRGMIEEDPGYLYINDGNDCFKTCSKDGLLIAILGILYKSKNGGLLFEDKLYEK